MMRKKLSVRANNVISDKIKVNDLRGNPIEMAAQVVWRVTDTAQALFDVDDYKAFVNVQIEAAVRTIGSRYPYDDFEHQEVTLRGNHAQIGGELRGELIARLEVAGITVDECDRSAKRRGGKECDSTCRSRWSPTLKKKK